MYARTNRRAVLLGLLGGGLAAAMQSYVDLADPAVAEASPIPGLPDGVIPDGWLPAPLPPLPPDTAAIAAKYAGAVPHEWGVAVTGTATRLAAAERRIALTFDACGGPQGDGVDADLLALLERERLPATLFVNGRWIDVNPGLTAQLAGNPLVELANHGTRHLPLSVTGKSAYGIAGTTSPAEVIDEVWVNHNRLLAITGRPPRWFRPGTAHCDEVAASIVRDLGEQVVGFTVNGDAGATLPAAKVQAAVTSAAPGSVVIMHVNRPAGATAEGLAAAVSQLRSAGVEFVTLSGAGSLA